MEITTDRPNHNHINDYDKDVEANTDVNKLGISPRPSPSRPGNNNKINSAAANASSTNTTGWHDGDGSANPSPVVLPRRRSGSRGKRSAKLLLEKQQRLQPSRGVGVVSVNVNKANASSSGSANSPSRSRSTSRSTSPLVRMRQQQLLKPQQQKESPELVQSPVIAASVAEIAGVLPQQPPKSPPQTTPPRKNNKNQQQKQLNNNGIAALPPKTPLPAFSPSLLSPVTPPSNCEVRTIQTGTKIVCTNNSGGGMSGGSHSSSSSLEQEIAGTAGSGQSSDLYTPPRAKPSPDLVEAIHAFDALLASQRKDFDRTIGNKKLSPGSSVGDDDLKSELKTLKASEELLRQELELFQQNSSSSNSFDIEEQLDEYSSFNLQPKKAYHKQNDKQSKDEEYGSNDKNSIIPFPKSTSAYQDQNDNPRDLLQQVPDPYGTSSSLDTYDSTNYRLGIGVNSLELETTATSETVIRSGKTPQSQKRGPPPRVAWSMIEKDSEDTDSLQHPLPNRKACEGNSSKHRKSMNSRTTENLPSSDKEGGSYSSTNEYYDHDGNDTAPSQQRSSQHRGTVATKNTITATTGTMSSNGGHGAVSETISFDSISQVLGPLEDNNREDTNSSNCSFNTGRTEKSPSSSPTDSSSDVIFSSKISKAATVGWKKEKRDSPETQQCPSPTSKRQQQSQEQRNPAPALASAVPSGSPAVAGSPSPTTAVYSSLTPPPPNSLQVLQETLSATDTAPSTRGSLPSSSLPSSSVALRSKSMIVGVWDSSAGASSSLPPPLTSPPPPKTSGTSHPNVKDVKDPSTSTTSSRSSTSELPDSLKSVTVNADVIVANTSSLSSPSFSSQLDQARSLPPLPNQGRGGRDKNHNDNRMNGEDMFGDQNSPSLYMVPEDCLSREETPSLLSVGEMDAPSNSVSWPENNNSSDSNSNKKLVQDDGGHLPKPRRHRKQRYAAILAILIGVVIGLTVVLIAVFGGGRSSSAVIDGGEPGTPGIGGAPSSPGGDETVTVVPPASPPATATILQPSAPETRPNTSSPPTANTMKLPKAPSVAPAPPMSSPATLMPLLVSVSSDGGAALNNASSPQHAAYQWLLGNSNLTSYSEERIFQRYALAVYYLSTDGNAWDQNELWMSNDDECRWFMRTRLRFRCTSNQQLRRLYLQYNNAAGTIPPELGLLSNLERIDLSGGPDRTLTGTLPSALGALTSLQELRIQNNVIHGEIPTELVRMSMLKYLDLSRNRLTGTLMTEIGQFQSLEALDVAENELEGTIPVQINGASKLETLSLSDNAFSGPLPASIGNLEYLESLAMRNNRISVLPTEIGNLLHLSVLDLSNNQLVGSLFTEIGRLQKLRVLSLQQNFLGGSLPAALGKFGIALEELDLSMNKFSGSIPNELGLIRGSTVKVNRVRVLRLNDNLLTGEVPASFANFNKLNSLFLQANDLTGAMPVGVCRVFNQTLPSIYIDCAAVDCPCCNFCCRADAAGSRNGFPVLKEDPSRDTCKCRYEDDPWMLYRCY